MFRSGPVLGLLGAVALTTLLATTTELGAAGWAAGLAYGAVLCGCLLKAGHTDFRPADWVTLSRAVLGSGVAALTAASFARAVPVVLFTALAAVALVLDAVDGRVARGTRTVSAHGARFDMETDAALILILSAYATHALGWWPLAIGLMRYAYVAASWVFAWLASPVPPRYWRKVVAAVQGIVLAVAAAGVLPRAVTAVAVLGALGLLVESFGRDVVWQFRHRVVPSTAPVSAPPVLTGAHR
ncbi:CDP-alcohol phosphatidyltransferase family protein [Hamadaea tsunoensis]|uniref:CDP-alcohol phosphatidyltransferase family protein n=1 Tax=Hamadaea tsunoensis TaxID=53368 RepID=UPI00040477C9|nr:CDP-alcohol phosphatidyltransferase family protein [Hamadaea tsunoensis]